MRKLAQPNVLADLPADWRAAVEQRVDAELLGSLGAFVRSERANAVVYPPEDEVFTALRRTPPSAVKAVLLGQDPYHGEGEAHGLSFSVKRGVKVPPSLRNLFKELQADLGIAPPDHGNLEAWADAGVLLLNTVLTVRRDEPGSHRRKGWEQVTDALLRELDAGPERLVFVLLGKDAQKKAALIDPSRHVLVSAPHPSPLSAHQGFFGCGLFSKVNRGLESFGRTAIDWSLE